MSFSSRVLFRESQLLRAADLQTEQQYLLGLAGRHQVAPHTWGIVRGLFINIQADVATVQPGLAIDGYGRELAVFQPVRISLSNQPATQFVYLYYCERPQGSCGQAPNPRFRDSAEIQIAPATWPIPTDETDLASVTAAGYLTGAAPWPVLLGIIRFRNNTFHLHYSHCLYTRLRSSLVYSSVGGTLVRIGAENLADPYHFRISLKDSTNFLQKRFALDRQGNAIFWGNLILTSPQRGAVLSTQIDGMFLKALVKSSVVGPVRVQSSFQPGNPSKLTISFRVNPVSSNASALDVFEIESHSRPATLKDSIKRFNKHSHSVHLDEVVSHPQKKITPLRGRFAAGPPPKPTLFFDDRELPLNFSGADLSFVPEDVPTPLPCDCLTPVDNPELLPEGFIFLPGTDAPKPPVRDIYRILLKPKDQPPSDEFRISGGAKKDGDFSRHVTISGQNSKGFIPLLTFRGDGSLALPGDLSVAALASHLLYVVGGAAQLPIVNPDPRDPLFNYLLVLAFIQGVMSASTQLIKVDFPAFPSFFETAQEVDYRFTLQNLSTTGQLTPDKCSETLITSSLAVFGSVPLTTNLLPFAAPTPVDVTHPASQIPTAATSMQVEIDVSMKLTNLSVGGKMRSPTVPILPSPAAAFSGLTDPIARNTHFDIAVSNASSVDFVLTDAQLTAPGPAQILLAGNLLIPAGQSKTLPVQAKVNGPAALHVQFTLSIIYHWVFNGAPGTDRPPLSFSTTVQVT
jgi:hypothetical protein